MFVSL